MREGQAEAVFAGLGQNRREAVGGEVVELVYEQVEVAAFGFGHVGAGHGRQLESGREQGTEQVGFVSPEFAFGEVGDEHAAGVHHEAEVHPGFHLSKNVPDGRVHEELADFVLNWGDGFPDEAIIVTGEFILPEAADERVIYLMDLPQAPPHPDLLGLRFFAGFPK
jgi:hypothetical protein